MRDSPARARRSSSSRSTASASPTLDTYATTSGLPTFTPTVVGDVLPEPYGETTMDLQVAHAIAPDARKVVVNARPTVGGGGAYVKIGQLPEDTADQFPERCGASRSAGAATN